MKQRLTLPGDAPDQQVLQGKLTYLGLIVTISGFLGNLFGAKFPKEEVDGILTWVGANWDSLAQFGGLVTAAWGRFRMNLRGAALLLLVPLLGSCSSTKKQATPAQPDAFDSAFHQIVRGMVMFLAFALVSCAPGFTATFHENGMPKTMAQTTGFLHEADKLAVKTKLPNGMEYTVVMIKPNGTKVAKAAIGGWAASKISFNKETTAQVKDTNAANVAGKKIEADKAIELGKQGQDTTKAGLDAGVFAKEATTFTQPK